MNSSCFPRKLMAAALAITAFAVLAGCATVNPSEQIAKDRLEKSRTAYSQAKANPIVESYALKTLQEAEKTLQAAEEVRTKAYSTNPNNPSKAYTTWEKNVFFNDISRLAYMAERKSQTAVALAEGVVTQNEIAKLGKEKAEVELLKSQLAEKLLQQDLDAKAAALEAAKRQLASATSEAERQSILADIKAKEAALAQARAERQASEAEMARAEMAELMKELSELQGQLTDRGIVLTIGDVLFAFDKADLNASAQNSMDKIAAFLQKKQNRNLLVEGHTDNVGTEEYNQKLSEQRAASVKSALVKRGIAAERIVTIGYSKNYPLASNDNATGRQQNRRVEAIILNQGVLPASQFRK